MPGRLQQRILRTMALCWRTHLSHRGEVRGPDHSKITQEQTSLNARGAMEGWREEKIKRCRNVEEKRNAGGETNEGECGEWKRSL